MVWIPDHIWFAQKKGNGKGQGGKGKGWGDVWNPASFWGKGTGGWNKKSFSGDFDKAELISKIKDFQRSSEEQKQAWWTFCDSQGSGNRDPARHEADVLRAFLAEQGIECAQGNNFVKGELMNKLKAFQRSGEENKQAWWAFCDGQEGQKRDPALYEVDVLKKFLAQHGIQGVKGTMEQKKQLVEKVKKFQKSGEDSKQTWWAYCDTQPGQKRDPALHEIDFLKAFLKENGIS